LYPNPDFWLSPAVTDQPEENHCPKDDEKNEGANNLIAGEAH